jgi:hypothetical protein
MTRRELVRALLPAGLLVVSLTVLLRAGGWPTKAKAGVEATLYLAVFTLILMRDAPRSHIGALRRPHRALLAIFFALILAGHFANDPRATFPFSAWSMYGRPESPDTLQFYRSEGIDSSRRRVVIDEADLFPPIGGSAIASKVKRLAAQALAAPHPLGRGMPQRRLTEWLHAVGAAYNQRHPERPIRAVELVRYSVNLREPATSGLAARRIWRVELDIEPSR